MCKSKWVQLLRVLWLDYKPSMYFYEVVCGMVICETCIRRVSRPMLVCLLLCWRGVM